MTRPFGLAIALLGLLALAAFGPASAMAVNVYVSN
jgi:hypothetical protein